MKLFGIKDSSQSDMNPVEFLPLIALRFRGHLKLGSER